MAAIRSIQRGSIPLTATGLTDTFTLSRPVVPANCWLINNGVVSAANAVTINTQACLLLTLTDATTVSVRRGHGTTAATVYFTVVELEPGIIDSIQTGAIDIPAGETSGTATLAIVPDANAFLDTTGSSFAVAGNGFAFTAGMYTLTLSGTTVTATLNTPVAAGETYSIGYSVVDLTEAVVRAAHQVTVPLAAGTVFNATIPPVDTGRAFIIINGWNHQWCSILNGGNTNCTFVASFGSATQATFTRQASVATAGTLTAYVIEFASGALAAGAVQSGNIIQTTVTATAPLIPVGADAICFPGGARLTTGSNNNGSSVATTLVNAQTVQAASFQIFGTNTVGYWVIDILEHEPGLGVIESIQQISITIPANQLSATYTLDPPVDVANAAIFWNGRSTNYAGNAIQLISVGLVLTNATTVTATRGATVANPVTVCATVVEFIASVVNSIQYGSIQIEGAVSDTYELPIPVSTNAFVINNGVTVIDASNVANSEAAVSLGASLGALPTGEAGSLASIVTATLGVSGTATVFFCVVDLTSEVIASVQQVELILGGNAAVRTATINPVISANTILVCGGLATASTNWGNAAYRAQLTSSTVVTFIKGATAGSTPYLVIAVVQFQSAVLSPRRVQRGITTLTSQASNSSRLPNPVDRARALCNWAGFSTALGSGNPGQGLATSLLTDEGETQTSAIGLLNPNANVTSWEVIEFDGGGEPPEPELPGRARHGAMVVMA